MMQQYCREVKEVQQTHQAVRPPTKSGIKAGTTKMARALLVIVKQLNKVKVQ